MLGREELLAIPRWLDCQLVGLPNPRTQPRYDMWLHPPLTTHQNCRPAVAMSSAGVAISKKRLHAAVDCAESRRKPEVLAVVDRTTDDRDAITGKSPLQDREQLAS